MIKEWTPEELVAVEKRIVELFRQKKIRSMFHLSSGNESQLIEIFRDVKPEDWCLSTHRSHYHALLKGMSPEKLISEVVRGKSMHLYDRELKFFTSSIVGGVLPIAVGVALSIKLKGDRERVWVFVGDMCSRMGVFHECVQYAQGYDLPIFFVIEDNGMCINSNTKDVWGRNDAHKIVDYVYTRKYPHSGTGDWISFQNEDDKTIR